MTMGPTKEPATARPEEQQGPEKRKETIRSGEPTKLTLWAVASRGEQPKGKGEEQPKRTLKKIEGRVRGWWKTTAPEDGARGQTNWRTQEEARSHKTKSRERDLGTPEQGKDDLINTPTTAGE